MLEDMDFSPSKLIHFFSDNKAAIYISHNPMFHERTKHLKLDCHYVRAQIMEGLINTLYVRSF